MYKEIIDTDYYVDVYEKVLVISIVFMKSKNNVHSVPTKDDINSKIVNISRVDLHNDWINDEY